MRFSRNILKLFMFFILFSFVLSSCINNKRKEDGKVPQSVQLIERNFNIINAEDGVELYATLTYPKSYSTNTPLVILVHGSGPQGRDQVSKGSLLYYHSGIENPFFKELSKTFAQNGMAVIRYDKRTCIAANSKGKCEKKDFDWDVDSTTLNHFESDVRTMVDYTQSIEEFNKNKIILLGHSQGANIVPRVAKDYEQVVGVVLIGPPAAKDPVASYNDQKYLIKRYLELLTPNDKLDKQIEKIQNEIENEERIIKEIWEDKYSGDFQGSDAGFWKSWLKYQKDMKIVLSNLDKPIFAVAGAYDFNTPPVPMLDNIRQWREGESDDLILTIPRGNHCLVIPTETSIGIKISSYALTNMTNWMGLQFGMAKKSAVHKAPESEIEKIRDAMLCSYIGEECDLKYINEHLTRELKNKVGAKEIISILGSKQKKHGKMVKRETVHIDFIKDIDKIYFRQTDFIKFEDDAHLMLRTVWVDGPLLAGFFFL